MSTAHFAPVSIGETNHHVRRAWVLADDKPGTVNQCIGLAEALGREADLRIVQPRRWCGWLPSRLMLAFGGTTVRARAGARLQPPWPDLVIAGGRSAAVAAADLRRRGRGAVRVIAVQAPRLPLRCFDLVIAPAHDRLSGPNVVVTAGALHRVTAARLEAAGRAWTGRFADVPQPRLGVLLGGGNRHFRFGANEGRDLGAALRRLSEAGFGLLLTASRRSDPNAITAIRDALAGRPAFFWDGTGENPYFAILALSDVLLATADSVSMLSEAASVGRRLYIARLTGAPGKFARFHDHLVAAGAARFFEGRIEDWRQRPLDDMARAAAAVERLLPAAGSRRGG